MRKKKEIKQVQTQQVGWVDPNPDPYGFEISIEKLKLNGYQAEKVSGILMVTIPSEDLDSFNRNFARVKNIITDSGFLGSWGARFSTLQDQRNRFI